MPQGWNFDFLPGTAGQIRSIDRRAQEDARSILFPGTGTSAVAIQAPAALDFNRQFTGQLHLVMEYRIDRRPTGPVVLRMLSGSAAGADVPVTNTFRSAPLGQWQTLTLPLGCFGRGLDATKITAPLVIETAGQLGLSVSDVKIISANTPQGQCGS
ncbi:putative glycoside hydrolase [Sphingomonas piscis]|uniref:putative glycoside hydrolase n=1 Tax=Sphingomonas piscis TaxID=2714943 RepID=UPI001FEC7F43|nr:putative glycoside hydrolase [Sphingomonas piscis]